MNNLIPNFKKIIFAITIFTCASLIFSGCANDEYAIEKRYWKVKKQAEKILNNPHATPPNELERTVSNLNKFSEKFPKSNLGIDADFSIANLYTIKENYDSGRAQLKKLAKKYEKFKELAAQALFLIGNSYELQDNWPSALEQYKKIMQNYTETIRGLEIPVYIAQHYKTKYEPDKMIAAFQEAINYYQAIAAKHPVTPLSFNMNMLVVQCYSETKDWPSAVNTLNSMLTTYKGKVSLEEILLNLSSIYSEKLNNPTKTIEILEILLKEYPKSKYTKPAKEMIKRLSAK
ncbi:MAG: tetratricopeptide repeat protein [Candidatus Omnitrophica bacterium]|nr:tetratricopeptide repeat protein [Candidatus Omnitrophota bacterium]